MISRQVVPTASQKYQIASFSSLVYHVCSTHFAFIHQAIISKPEHNKHKQDKDQQHPKHLFVEKVR